MQPILVTGATGNIGRHVVSKLQALKHPIRIAKRSQASAPDAVLLDLSNPETYVAAIHGCGALFLLRPPAISNTKKTLNVLIDRAYEAGVRHIVFVSVSGAENNSIVPHHAVEQQLIHSGKSYTILRPGFFSQNIETAYRNDIVTDNRIYLPSGTGLINFIDTRDIAEVAVQSLVDPKSHNGNAYTLAGSRAVTFHEVAEILSNALNRPVTYQQASSLGYFMHVVRQGTPWIQALVQTILHRGLRSGQANIEDATAQSYLAGIRLALRLTSRNMLKSGNSNLPYSTRNAARLV